MWTIDELCLHPREAIRFCDDFPPHFLGNAATGYYWFALVVQGALASFGAGDFGAGDFPLDSFAGASFAAGF